MSSKHPNWIQARTLIVSTVMTISMIFLAGCGRDSTGAPRTSTAPNTKELMSSDQMVCSKLGEVTPRALFAALPDRTGSHWDGPETTRLVKTELISHVMQLLPGTQVFVHFISGQTYSNRETIIRDVIPWAPSEVDCQVKNRWDRKQVAHCKAVQKKYQFQRTCVDVARKRIIQRIQDLNPSTADVTDISGGFILVEEIFRAYPQATRTLWVASDFQDNVRLALPPYMFGFKGSTVLLRTTPRGNPLRLQQAMRVWETRLKRWGANVETHPLGIAVAQKKRQQVNNAP